MEMTTGYQGMEQRDRLGIHDIELRGQGLNKPRLEIPAPCKQTWATSTYSRYGQQSTEI